MQRDYKTEKQIERMRNKGMKFREIAEKTGKKLPNVHRVWKRIMKEKQV